MTPLVTRTGDRIEARISGLEEVRAALLGIAPKLRVRALRDGLRAGGRLVQRAARAATPLIDPMDPAVLRGRRKPGTVRKAISVRTSKLARRSGDVGVFVNVRPAPRGKRGAKSRDDPFYWRWINWGWNPAQGSDGAGKAGVRFRRKLNRQAGDKRKAGLFFLEAGAAQLGAALSEFMRYIGPRIQKLNTPKAPAP